MRGCEGISPTFFTKKPPNSLGGFEAKSSYVLTGVSDRALAGHSENADGHALGEAAGIGLVRDEVRAFT